MSSSGGLATDLSIPADVTRDVELDAAVAAERAARTAALAEALLGVVPASYRPLLDRLALLDPSTGLYPGPATLPGPTTYPRAGAGGALGTRLTGIETNITTNTGNITANTAALALRVLTSRYMSIGTGGAPTAAALAANGTSPPTPTMQAGSNDTIGSVWFGSGTAPGNGDQASVTFHTVYTAAPFVIICKAAGITNQLHVTSTTTAGFNISSLTAPVAGLVLGAFKVNYLVIGV